MDCNMLLEPLEKNLGILLTPEKKKEFCRWAEKRAEEGKFNLPALLARSPDPIPSKLNEIRKQKEWDLPNLLNGIIEDYLKS